jgi:hypothetical protein
MKINFRKYFALGLCLMAALMVACNPTGEQNFEFEPGSSLLITGPAEINTLSPTDYYVRGFTVNYDYDWTLDGPDGEITVLREGEYVRVTANEPGTYTLNVTRNGVSGSTTITAASVRQELGFEETTSAFRESEDTIQVPVMIADRNPEGASVSFTVTGEGITEGEDFRVLTESPLELEAGETSGNIEIVWLNNNLTRDEQRSLNLTLNEIVSTGAGEAAVSLTESVELREHMITIEEDEKEVGLAERQNVKITSEEEAGNFYFDIELSEPVSERVEVMYTIPDEFNDLGENVIDAALGRGSVFIYPGETTARIRVEIPEEAIVDGAEYTITLDEISSADEEVVIAEEADEATITVDFSGE